MKKNYTWVVILVFILACGLYACTSSGTSHVTTYEEPEEDVAADYDTDYDDDTDYDYNYSYDTYDTEDGYGYDKNDPYYSTNDHNNDGKIDDDEFQDALGDYLDDATATLENDGTDYGTGYGYDDDDPYYSTNDHNNDGLINDSEFQDALGDYLDDVVGDDY